MSGPEYTEVELPLIGQLQKMGWTFLEGDREVPEVTGRSTFKETILEARLRQAVRSINAPSLPWLEEHHVSEAVSQLTRFTPGRLMETNAAVTEMLLSGVTVTGPDGKGHTVKLIDFTDPLRNDLLVINQFRVDPPGYSGGKGYIVPDLVLFVNGLPLVVVECKSPDVKNPLEAAIEQMLKYQDLRGSTEPEGVERLFHTAQLLVGTNFYQACLGTVGARAEHYGEWKDTFPLSRQAVEEMLGKTQLHAQQVLAAGVLRPGTLLDLLQNFTLNRSGRKVVARYQQYRAVRRAIERLENGETRALGAEVDGRGGIVWHTQGSGKSLTMTFLVRALRTARELRAFKVVIITDRRDLEEQLTATAKAAGEPVQRAQNVESLKALLKQPGSGFVFGMVQKFRPGAGEEGEGSEVDLGNALLNSSEKILVMVDEAHRSHTGPLHASLRAALPNAAMIGFTGTPIVKSASKKTHEIFGPFIDTYTILQSQQDKATVPIRYEGRVTRAGVSDGKSLDGLFEDMFEELTPQQREKLQQKYGTIGDILEAPKLIAAKAKDMLLHYASTILPNGFKGQVVASSRLAAVRYHAAFQDAQRELVKELEELEPYFLELAEEQLQKLDSTTRSLVSAHPFLQKLRETEFAVVISGTHNDKPEWANWTSTGKQKSHIDAFTAEEHPLRLLIVNSMLLTGFDAPVEQVMYLDRNLKDHTLLQAIARVNRTCSHKTYGLVVDYFGVGQHLTKALAAYTDTDIQGAMVSIKDTLPKLIEAHHAVTVLFREKGIQFEDREGCVNLLSDKKLRSDFSVKLNAFYEALDTVLPRPEGLPYVRDAKMLGAVASTAREVYDDSDAPFLPGAGEKVKALIARYVQSQGISLKIAPVEVLDPNFRQKFKKYQNPRTQAAAMEHAVRRFIRMRHNEDPVHYRKLSEKLEELLKEYENRWDLLAEALAAFIQEIQAGRPADNTGLDPKTQAPFFSLLLEAQETPAGQEKQKELALATVNLVNDLRQRTRVVDFWRNPVKRQVTRGWLVGYLDDHNLIPFEKCETCADDLMHLARSLHVRLMEGVSSSTS